MVVTPLDKARAVAAIRTLPGFEPTTVYDELAEALGKHMVELTSDPLRDLARIEATAIEEDGRLYSGSLPSG